MNEKDPCKGCNSYIPYYTNFHIEGKQCSHIQDQKLRNSEVDSSFFADCPCINCLVKSICDKDRKLNWASYSCNGKTENHFFCKVFFDYISKHTCHFQSAGGWMK